MIKWACLPDTGPHHCNQPLPQAITHCLGLIPSPPPQSTASHCHLLSPTRPCLMQQGKSVLGVNYSAPAQIAAVLSICVDTTPVSSLLQLKVLWSLLFQISCLCRCTQQECVPRCYDRCTGLHLWHSFKVSLY